MEGLVKTYLPVVAAAEWEVTEEVRTLDPQAVVEVAEDLRTMVEGVVPTVETELQIRFSQAEHQALQENL
jgi:hypothetical protein